MGKNVIIFVLFLMVIAGHASAAPLPPTKPGICSTPTARPPATPTRIFVK